MMRTPTFFVVLLVASSSPSAEAQQDHCVETGNGEHYYADEGRADGYGGGSGECPGSKTTVDCMCYTSGASRACATRGRLPPLSWYTTHRLQPSTSR